MYDLEEIAKKIDSPELLHNFALKYNWDYGLEVPRWIINNPSCDRGTALLIYWLAGPKWYYQYATRDDVPNPEWDKEQYKLQEYDFICWVEEKYLSNEFNSGVILFNPRHDRSEGMLGFDWTQEYSEKPEGRKIPAIMFEPSIPDEEWEKLGRPIVKSKVMTLDDSTLDEFFEKFN